MKCFPKLRGIKQRRIFVEDYAQKFNQYLNRLANTKRPTDEMLVRYFMKGLCKEL